MAAKQNKQIVLLLVAILLLVLGLILIGLPYIMEPNTFGLLNRNNFVEIPFYKIPKDTFYIGQDRQVYQDGSMELSIPALDLRASVGVSTKKESLAVSPGLYEVSQMPGTGDVNVSIRVTVIFMTWSFII